MNNSKGEFPKVWTKCPGCGSEKRLAQGVADQLIADGKANPALQAWLFGHQSVIVDQSRPFLSAPTLLTKFDACAECGAVYCVSAVLAMAVPKSQTQRPQGPLHMN